MSEEQNARINEAFRIRGHGREILTDDDIEWFISELEKCREENQLLNALFDMQQTRMKKAIKLWQQATGKKDVLPDLGVLLEWLMAEPERCRVKVKELISTQHALVKAQANVQLREIGKQRRHRKWALKKAKSYLYNPCATVVYDAGETRTRLNDWLI